MHIERTLSGTSFLFFCRRPIKLSDRKMPLIARAKFARTANCWCSYERGNAEKSFLGQRILFFSFSLKCKISSLKEKVKIISESELEICALIYRPQLESISVSIFLFTSVAIACKRQMFLLAHRPWGTTFTSCQKLLVPMGFFLWRADYAGGFYGSTEQMLF